MTWYPACVIRSKREMISLYLSANVPPPQATTESERLARTPVPVAAIELVNVARLLAKSVHTYIGEFGQPSLLSFSSVQDPLALFLLLVQQLGDGFLALPSIIGIAYDRNYTYPIRLEKLLSKHIIAGRRDLHAFEKHFHIPNL
jgi:hypothetical protein